MHRRQQLGRAGEALAADHLAALGYRILDRNWRPNGSGVRGELDLIVRDGAVLAFCEVRTRSSDRAGTPAESVSADKRRRLRRLAALYLQAHPHSGPVRGDVVAVRMGHGGAPSLQHMRGVW